MITATGRRTSQSSHKASSVCPSCLSERCALASCTFVGAALVMTFSSASFAELGTRMPISASEAEYVQAAFRRDWLSLGIGLIVVITATVSAATISVGSAGYIAVLLLAFQLLNHATLTYPQSMTFQSAIRHKASLHATFPACRNQHFDGHGSTTTVRLHIQRRTS